MGCNLIHFASGDPALDPVPALPVEFVLLRCFVRASVWIGSAQVQQLAHFRGKIHPHDRVAEG